MDIAESVANAVSKSIAPIAENAVATLGNDGKAIVERLLRALSGKEIIITLPNLIDDK